MKVPPDKERAAMLATVLRHGLKIHPDQIEELRAAGIEVPPKLVVAPSTRPNGVVCTEFTGPASLLMLDNAVTACAWGCGRKVQYRPKFLPDVPKVCAYCAAERPEKDQ